MSSTIGGTSLLNTSSYSPLGANKSSTSKSFLNYSETSGVQKLVQAQTAKTSKTPYTESVDYLRMKANEISRRIALYKNMGYTEGYQLAQQEGVEVVKKYQALLKKQAPTSTTSTTA